MFDVEMAMLAGVQSPGCDVSAHLSDAVYDTLGAQSLLEIGAAMRIAEPCRSEFDVNLVLHVGAGQISWAVTS